jgi:tRNA-splicing ligase RtcB (3'-phosphate/5'-hydroxy nucleic acid ligase)
MKRIDENRILIDTPQMDITLFANEDVYVDNASINEITSFIKIINTISNLKNGTFLSSRANLNKLILTPDFHKAAGIPVGTVAETEDIVIPKAVGNDIGCGVLYIMTDVTGVEFASLGKLLDEHLRYIFFEGGRNIPLSKEQRQAIFLSGIPGLYSVPHSDDGIWKYWNNELPKNMDNNGGYDTNGIFGMDDFIKGSDSEYTFDDQIGSIGGGNHFCEFQLICEIFDRHKSYEWGLKKDYIGIMVHSGSVGIGHIIGNHFTDLAKSLYPKNMSHDNAFYLLSNNDDYLEKYMSAMGNAANFAFANRLFLGLMMTRALSESLGREIATRIVYDAPHNLIWRKNKTFLHRKGACPAEEDKPVLIPGSMGTSSYIMKGLSNQESLYSACHGAGRSRARQKDHNRKSVSDMSIQQCRIVTKVNPISLRPDIKAEYMRSLSEEGPDRYKDIDPVIATIEGANIAKKVARTFPLLTVKGL